MKEFNLKELKRYNGIDRKEIYFAFGGKVYDATNSFLWKNGKHQAMHFAGIDLTNELQSAPHGKDLLNRLPIIGILKKE